MTSPRIIRTVEELEALDPDTLLSSTGGGDQGGLARSAGYMRWAYHGEFDDDWPIPAVVVATGEQVRAAREALDKETNDNS